MKGTKAILIAIMICTITSICWGQTYWTKTYGSGTAQAISSTLDGNFIITGETNPLALDNGGGSKICLLKVTSNGDTLWSKTYGSDSDTYLDDIITPTSDGNFIIFGMNMPPEINLLKINSKGDTLWTKMCDVPSCPTAVAPTHDGNFLVVANSGTINILKISPIGDTLLKKTYGGQIGYDNFGIGGFAIAPMPDGDFLVAGYIQPTYPNNYCNYFLKINPNGDTVWTIIDGRSLQTIFCESKAISPAPDGNFIVAGSYDPYHVDGTCIKLLKIDSNGKISWEKGYYPGCNNTLFNYAYAISPTQDGNYIVAGSTQSNFLFLKITPNGDTLWTKMAGMGAADVIVPTSDGNFIAAGESNGNVTLLSIIDDRYAYKNTLFTFKIPVSGDSLKHTYATIKVPAGMTVSAGGTIAWTPTTNSVYMDHAEFMVADNNGGKDTLTFNIFVNSSYNAAIKPLPYSITNKDHCFSISQLSSSQIKFNVPSGTSSLDIYEIGGRHVQHIKPSGTFALWNKSNKSGTFVPTGMYFAKILLNNTTQDKAFIVVK